ncbi:MAG: Na/Pi symporter [Bacteroidota bacterium]
MSQLHHATPNATDPAEMSERRRFQGGGWRFVQLLGVLMLFLFAISLMSGSFTVLGQGLVKDLLEITSNPFVGLFIGLLATAVVQSSSTTTSKLVGLVAGGGMEISQAIPIIMGANVGTSVTSTIVSLGLIGNREEYQRAVAVSGLHNFFNILTVIILFVLEISTHFLSTTTMYLTSWIGAKAGSEGGVLEMLSPLSRAVVDAFPDESVIPALLALLTLFVSLRGLVWVFKKLVIGRLKENLDRVVFSGPRRALLSGFVSTAAVQSSSVTTSLMVPLVATGKVQVGIAFSFIMGANVGTTITALVAAIFVGGAFPQTALAVAFAHFLLNCIGVLLFFPIPFLRQLPINLAEKLGALAFRSRAYGVAYVVIVFFLLPALLIFTGT